MSTQPTSEWESKQAEHFDRLARMYEGHYSDPTGQKYRNKFINEKLFDKIDLSGRDVLDAMCGSGQTTGYLMSRGARVTCLDISPQLIETLRRKWPGCTALSASILDTPFDDETFDCVAVVGGLHHVHPDVDGAVDEVYRILKPGGFFCFMEPHAGSLPDAARKLWYRWDPLFEANEASIDLEAMAVKNQNRFICSKNRYGGSIAYLLVLQSLVFRMPLFLKRLYAPPLMLLESAISPFLHKRLACFALARWQKR
jgi:ubiquinone/menaquinone biosynthesis C-methylase UbiE